MYRRRNIIMLMVLIFALGLSTSNGFAQQEFRIAVVPPIYEQLDPRWEYLSPGSAAYLSWELSFCPDLILLSWESIYQETKTWIEAKHFSPTDRIRLIKKLELDAIIHGIYHEKDGKITMIFSIFDGTQQTDTDTISITIDEKNCIPEIFMQGHELFNRLKRAYAISSSLPKSIPYPFLDHPNEITGNSEFFKEFFKAYLFYNHGLGIPAEVILKTLVSQAPDFLWSYDLLGKSEWLLNNPDAATQAYDLLLKKATEENLVYWQVEAQVALGKLAAHRDLWQESTLHFNLAKQLDQNSENFARLAEINQCLGEGFLHQRQFEKAETFYQEALTLYKQFNYSPGLAQLLYDLGMLAYDKKTQPSAVDPEKTQISSKEEGSAKQWLLDALVESKKEQNQHLELAISFQLGVIETQQDHLSDALTYFYTAQTLASNLCSPTYAAKSAYQIGQLLCRLNQNTLAISYYERACSYFKESNQTDWFAQSCVELGILYYHEKQYDQAFLSLKSALPICHTLPDLSLAAKVHLYNARIQTQQVAEMETILQEYLQALAFALKLNPHATSTQTLLAEIYFELGWSYLEKHDYPLAIQNYEKALQVEESRQNIPKTAERLFDLGWLTYLNNDYACALTYYQKSATLFASINQQEGYAKCLHEIGWIELKLNHISQALNQLEQARDIYLSLNKKRELAQVYDKIGWVYYLLEDYTQSIQTYRIVLDLWTDLKHPTEQARALHKLGWLHTYINDFPASIAFYKRCFEIRSVLATSESPPSHTTTKATYMEPDPSDEASVETTLEDLAWAYKQLGEHAEAITYYQMALDTYRHQGSVRDQIDVLYQLGTIYRSTHQFDLAHYQIQQALTLTQSLHDDPIKISLLLESGILTLLSGDKDAAVPLLEKVISIAQSSPHHEKNKTAEAEAYYQLGGIYQTLHQWGVASQYYQLAFELFKKIPLPKRYIESHAAYAKLALQTKEISKAMNALEAIIPYLEQEKNDALSLLVYVHLAFCKNSLNHPEEAIALLQKSATFQPLATKELGTKEHPEKANEALELKIQWSYHMGIALKLLQRYDESLSFLNQAYNQTKIEDHLDWLAQAESQIGDVYAQKLDTDLAMVYLQNAATHYSMLGNMEEAGKIYNQMALLKYRAQDILQAFHYINHAGNMFQQMNDPLAKAKALDSLAPYYRQLGNREKSLETIKQAISIKMDLHATEEQALSFQILADIYFTGNENEKALASLQDTVNIYLELGLFDKCAPVYYKMAKAAYQLKQIGDAISYLYLCVGLEEYLQSDQRNEHRIILNQWKKEHQK